MLKLIIIKNNIEKDKIKTNEYFLNFFSIKNKKVNIKRNKIIGILFPAASIDKKTKIKKADNIKESISLLLILVMLGNKKNIKILNLCK